MNATTSTVRTLFGWTLVAFVLVLPAGCQHLHKRTNLAELKQAREYSFSGVDRLQAGDWEAAERHFRSAVEICPLDERGHAHLAESLRLQGRLDEAIDAQSQAVVKSGGDPRQHTQLGQLFLEAGRLDDASAQADLAIRKSRKSVAGWNLRGSVLIARNNLDEALSCLHRSQSLDPKQQWVHEQIAWIYERQQRPQRALATWYAVEELFAVDDVPASILYRQALALRALDRSQQAIDKLQLAQKRDPSSADVLLALADLQWQTGDRKNAEMTIRYAIDRWPTDPRMTHLARTLDPENTQWR